MVRRILLPGELEKRLDDLTTANQEVNGVLFYRQMPNQDCLVDQIFMTGVGSKGHVQALPERVEIVNAFLERFAHYSFIKFHTHSNGTIAEFGRYYAFNFSSSDEKIIETQLRDDPRYMALLVTPETKILRGIDNPKLRVVNQYPDIAKSQAVIQYLQTIAENKGYDINRLQATRKVR